MLRRGDPGFFAGFGELQFQVLWALGFELARVGVKGYESEFGV